MHYKKSRIDLSVIAVILSIALCAVLFFSLVDIPKFLSRATEYSAAVVLPNKDTSSAVNESSNSGSSLVASSQGAVNTAGEIIPVMGSASETDIPHGYLPVIEETRVDSGFIIEEKGIKVIDKTSLAPEININEIKNSFNGKSGTVLIYHTHGSEAYAENFTGYYSSDASIYSEDASKTVIAAGEALRKSLENAGISVIHDTSIFDNPSNSGAYLRAETRLKKLLLENPDITYIIDIHRGVIQQTGGARIKPTVYAGETKAAQLSIITGCDPSGEVGLPSWQKNLAFALNLQEALISRSPHIARPIALEERKYNFDLCENSLCIEIGTDANTAGEAVFTAHILGEELAKVISK